MEKEQQYQHGKIADKIIDFDFHIASSCAVCVSHGTFLPYVRSLLLPFFRRELTNITL
jgi:hypothetical protein